MARSCSRIPNPWTTPTPYILTTTHPEPLAPRQGARVMHRRWPSPYSKTLPILSPLITLDPKPPHPEPLAPRQGAPAIHRRWNYFYSKTKRLQSLGGSYSLTPNTRVLHPSLFHQGTAHLLLTLLKPGAQLQSQQRPTLSTCPTPSGLATRQGASAIHRRWTSCYSKTRHFQSLYGSCTLNPIPHTLNP